MIYTNEMIKEKNDKKIKLHRIFKIIAFPIMIIVLLLGLYVGYTKFIKKENDINILGFRFFMVSTGSMEPEYNIGDLIVIKNTLKENIKVGDVINFVSENGKDTVTHRVTEIVQQDGKTLYKTKGDNNSSEDSGLVDYEKVHGSLIFKVSKLGMIITKVFTGMGICIIFALVFLSYLRESRKEEKRISREEIRKKYNVPGYEKEDVI